MRRRGVLAAFAISVVDSLRRAFSQTTIGQPVVVGKPTGGTLQQPVLQHAVLQHVAAPGPGTVTEIYTVTNAGSFPSLPLPSGSLVFRNGLFQTPGINYDVIGGTAFRFRSSVAGIPALTDGDVISVATRT